MVFCEQCGKEIANDSKFCEGCGSSTVGVNTGYTDNRDVIRVAAVNNVATSGTVSNGLMWLQAFIPALGALFAFGTILIIAVNVVLCYVDGNNLKKAGYDISSFGNTWLVPIYLYKRAKFFNHGMGYFTVWCITFGLSFLGFL